MNIVIGTVESVEEIAGSEKLYKFMIDIGTEKRQVLGGLKLSYQPEELLNKQVLVIENLEPRKMMGTESQGMILAASNEDGKPVIIQPTKEVPNGSTIR
ncbi:MAG: methionine--tRNA ligase [Candidatus Paceibacterota bacterium]